MKRVKIFSMPASMRDRGFRQRRALRAQVLIFLREKTLIITTAPGSFPLERRKRMTESKYADFQNSKPPRPSSSLRRTCNTSSVRFLLTRSTGGKSALNQGTQEVLECDFAPILLLAMLS